MMLLRRMIATGVLIALVSAGLVACGRKQAAPPAQGDAPASIAQGNASFAQGRFADAAMAYRAVLDADAESDAARFNLALALVRDGRPEEAVAIIRPLAEGAGATTAARYILGLALLGSGDAAGAAVKLRAAAAAAPDDESIQYQLGLALARSGDAAGAREAFLRIAEVINPLHIGASSQLWQLAAAEGDAARAALHQADAARAAAEFDTEEQRDARRAYEASGINRFTRPVGAPSDFDPPAESPGVRFAAAAEALPGDLRGVLGSHLRADGSARLIAAPSGTSPAGAITANIDNDEADTIDTFFSGDRCALLLGDEDASARWGISDVSALDAAWTDIEADGHLDIITARGDAGIGLLRNIECERLEDQTDRMRTPAALTHAARVAAGELNDDDAPDLAVAGDSGAWVLLNAPGDDFDTADRPPVRIEGRAIDCAIDDINNDGTLDAAFLFQEIGEAAATLRFLNMRGDPVPQATIDLAGASDLELIDADADGFLDALLVGEQGVRLLRNAGSAGWQDRTEAAGLAGIAPPGRAGRAAAIDLDADRSTDLLLMAPGSPPTAYTAAVEGPAHAILIEVRGIRQNRSSIGARIELVAGDKRIVRNIGANPALIALGALTEPDAAIVTWGNGQLNAHDQPRPGESIVITDPGDMAGSCPFLYVWEGERFRFVTDILGSAPMGLPLRPGVLIPADTDDILWLGDASSVALVEDGPRSLLSIEITNEMPEVIYLDHVHALVVDVPAGMEAHPSDRIVPPPFERSRILTVRSPEPAVRAIDSSGRDVTALLREADRARFGPIVRKPLQRRGHAERHTIELEFTGLDASKPAALVMTGWMQWADANINIGAGHGPPGANPFPSLEALTSAGWSPVDVIVGAPAGKTKTIVIELTGKLPEGATALRISSALDISWDRIALGEPALPVEPAMVPLASAVLRERGVSLTRQPTRFDPLEPIHDALRDSPNWRRIPRGWHTRPGDVLPLLASLDDALVILTRGDAVRMNFDVSALPPPAEGTTRHYFVYTDGWDKDSNFNVIAGDTVDPLPWHGMDDQRYGSEPYPFPEAKWIAEYNTRWIDGGWSGPAPER